MNKKILIASIFATLMLLVPISSVVGVSDVENDCGCQVVNRYDLFRVKLLLVRIRVITNILLLRFGNIPEIAEKCEEILDLINSNRQLDYPIICNILGNILEKLESLMVFIAELIERFEDNEILINILGLIGLSLIPIYAIIYYIGIFVFDCWEK